MKGSLDMPPQSARNDAVDSTWGSLELNPDFDQGHSACAQASHFTDVRIRKSCIPVSFATRQSFGMKTRSTIVTSGKFLGMYARIMLVTRLRSLSALLVPVSTVFRLCSKPEAGRRTARWRIASVADAHPCWNVAEMNLPTHPVSQVDLFLKSQYPVSFGLPVSLPQPAFIRSSLIHLCPKPGFVFFRDLWQGLSSLIRGHARIWVRGASARQSRCVPSFLSFLTLGGNL
jgi:hypothetical protein